MTSYTFKVELVVYVDASGERGQEEAQRELELALNHIGAQFRKVECIDEQEGV